MPVPISISNNSGFTLVEVLVAMVITLISTFALLEAVDVATAVNLKNMQREEGVQIAADRMTHFRAIPFANISANYATEYVPAKLRGLATASPYRVVKSSVNLSSNSKLINVRVRWLFKNMSTSHEVQSVVQQ